MTLLIKAIQHINVCMYKMIIIQHTVCDMKILNQNYSHKSTRADLVKFFSRKTKSVSVQFFCVLYSVLCLAVEQQSQERPYLALNMLQSQGFRWNSLVDSFAKHPKSRMMSQFDPLYRKDSTCRIGFTVNEPNNISRQSMQCAQGVWLNQTSIILVIPTILLTILDNLMQRSKGRLLMTSCPLMMMYSRPDCWNCMSSTWSLDKMLLMQLSISVE